MKEEFLNIVALIVRQMSAPNEEIIKGRSILEGLIDEGYDPVEIDDALSWFESLAGTGEELGGTEVWPGFKGIRVQTPDEMSIITPEAFAYLRELTAVGVLDETLAETVLDKVCELGISGFGLEELKALLGIVLYTRDGVPSDELLFMLDASVSEDAIDN